MSPYNTAEITLWGAGGLLGSRILTNIQTAQPDINVNTVVIHGTDTRSWVRLVSRLILMERRHSSPLTILVAGTRTEIIKLLNKAPLPRDDIALVPLEESDCQLQENVIVDARALKDNSHHENTSVPVIFQSGIFPAETLAVPPFAIDKTRPRLRAGDCLTTGLASVLYPLRDQIKKISAFCMIQRQRPFNDRLLFEQYTKDAAVNRSIEHSLGGNIQSMLPRLEPDEDVTIRVIETPGHEYYLVTLELVLTSKMSRDDIITLLKQQPRIFIAPPWLRVSTGDLRQFLETPLRERGRQTPPIVCFSHKDGLCTNGTKVTMRIAIDSRNIAVLSNIDLIRTMVFNVSPLAAMFQTDENCNFSKATEAATTAC